MADSEDDLQARALLHRMFYAAIDRAMAEHCIAGHLPERPSGRTIVVGAGKASAEMARAFERRWSGELTGLVIVPYGHKVPCERIAIRQAAHPVSDPAGVVASGDMLALLEDMAEGDLVVCLLSGGGSALLCAPEDGIDFAELQTIGRALLKSGADIAQMNAVRKKLAKPLGGGIARAAAPARLVTLAISDVVGDDRASIASGPTVPDHASGDDALAILASYGVEMSTAVETLLRTAASDDPIPDACYTVIASSRSSCDAAAAIARDAGYAILDLGEVTGEAREVGRDHAELVRKVVLAEAEVSAPCIILSRGETSVTVRGEGRGGRNGEYLLSLLTALDGAAGVHALAADTDGIDGAGDNAGAWFEPGLASRARESGHDPREYLTRQDSYAFFEAMDRLVMTGPTRTNVNDFRAILIQSTETPQ
ncbi:glycerate kinase type-2 family protein [Alteriqipengyuania lutimaris]|nr:glycerate kinase [Alteriqipengyuania lutimaris]MBB3034703.1 hydroxypyruvate reductase [Alteriqipengyuania lutimaris]